MANGCNDTGVAARQRDRSDIPIGETNALIQDFYGFQIVEAKALGGELDHNLRVTDAHGQRYLAKLTPASLASQVVDWQEAVLDRLAERPISVEVPRLLLNRWDQQHSEVVVGGQSYLLRLLTWIEGEIMANADVGSRTMLRQLGRVAAEIPRSLEGLIQPVGVEDHHWLVVRSKESIEESLDAVTETEWRRSVETILGWFNEATSSFDTLPVATVHQDLNDFNVLVTEASDTSEAQLAGVLDFNDAVTTIRIAELAVAGAYAMLRKPDPISAFCEVVAGYRELADMTGEELDVVFPLAATRLCVNATTWTKRTSLESHRYGESRKQATWPTVLKLAQADPKEVAARIRTAE